MREGLHKEHAPISFQTANVPTKPPQAASAHAAHPGAGHSLSQISISAPGDASEQQADAVAAEVVQCDVPDRETAMLRDTGLLGGTMPPGGLTLQRKETGATLPQTRAGVGLSGAGTPLDPATRAFMEPRFGHDFSHVRVHTGSEAAQASDSLAARAFTVGSDIAFRLGEYAPGTGAGRELLAHELTHVLQQNSGPSMIQRKPAPGGLSSSTDVGTFEAAAARWLSVALDNSARITADERKSLGLAQGGGKPTDGGAAISKLQDKARWLAIMQGHESDAEWAVINRISPPNYGAAMAGVDTTDYEGRRQAINKDPTVLDLRKKTLAKQQEFGKEHPILLSSEINFRELADADTDKGAGMASARLIQVEKAIADCRAALGKGSLTIWDLPDLVPEAMRQLGISHKSPLGSAIMDKMLASQKKKDDYAWWVAAFQLGLGIASLMTAGAGLVVAGGLGEGGSLVVGAATTIPSLVGDTVSFHDDLKAHNQGKMTANTHLDQQKAFTHTQPSLMPLAGDIFQTVVDVFGAGMLARDAHQFKLMRGVAEEVEQVVDRAAPILTKGTPQNAEAELREIAANKANVLIAERRIKPGMKQKFIDATEKVWNKKFAKTMHIQAEGAAPHPAGGGHLEGAGHGLAEAPHATAHPSHASTTHPTTARPASIESPQANLLDEGSRGAGGQLEVGGHGQYIPTKTPEQLKAIRENAARHKVPSHEPVAVPADPITASVEAAEPQIKTLENGTQVLVGDGPRTIVQADGISFTEGQGWHDAGGKPLQPETIWRDAAGNPISHDAWRAERGLPPRPEVERPVTASERPVGETTSSSEKAPASAEPVAPSAATPGDQRFGWLEQHPALGTARPDAPKGVPADDNAMTAAFLRSKPSASPENAAAIEDALAKPDTKPLPAVGEPPKPVETIETAKTGGAAETGSKIDGPHQDPSAEFPAGATAHAPAQPVALADMSQIDKVRARLNALKEQKEYSYHYDDVWSGTQTQVGKASSSAASLDAEINRTETALRTLEAKANLPEGVDMKARLASPASDPISLINENQSWGRLGELNLGSGADTRLLAARDALVMRLKSEIEEEFHVFIHAGDGNRIIDKVTAGKVTTDIDLVVTSRAAGEEVAQADLGRGSLRSRSAEARAELQRRLNQAFSGDSNRVAMVNVFMGDKRLPFLSAEAMTLKAAQDTEGMVEGLRSLKEVNPQLYEAQKSALLQGTQKGDPVQTLVASAEKADKTRVDNIDAALKEQNVDPVRATPAQKTAAQEQVRQQKEKATEEALHRYEAQRAGATPEQIKQMPPEAQKELDELAAAHNKAVQELAIYTPEAYTPHGSLEIPLSKREIALGTIEDDLSKPLVQNNKGQMVPAKKDLTLPIAAQSALGETRMFLDVLHTIPTPVNRAAHCAKYLGRFLNQFLQVIELDRYPMISRLGTNLERFQTEMVAVKDVGDENAKIRRLMDVLGDDSRNPTAVVQQFIDESERMMVDLNTRLVKGSLGVPESLLPAGAGPGPALP